MDRGGRMKNHKEKIAYLKDLKQRVYDTPTLDFVSGKRYSNQKHYFLKLINTMIKDEEKKELK